MSTAQIIFEKVNELPPEKQEQVLHFTESLSEADESSKPYAFLDAAMKLKLDGPKDWSRNFEEYLRGEKKDVL
ncbi:MAG TPA: hypothetical protein VF437_04710 [Verrucomicrobiae bacterium]